MHPSVVKNTVTKAAEYAGTAQTVSSAVFGAIAGFGAKKATGSPAPPNSTSTAASGSAWAKWAGPAAYAVGGAIIAGAAAGSAYYQREQLTSGISWATEHMQYVGNLWDEQALRKRIDALVRLDQEGVVFRVWVALVGSLFLCSSLADSTRLFPLVHLLVHPAHSSCYPRDFHRNTLISFRQGTMLLQTNFKCILECSVERRMTDIMIWA